MEPKQPLKTVCHKVGAVIQDLALSLMDEDHSVHTLAEAIDIVRGNPEPTNAAFQEREL